MGNPPGDRLGEADRLSKGGCWVLRVMVRTMGRAPRLAAGGGQQTGLAQPISLISASAFSSQYVMSISRYIVVAVVRERPASRTPRERSQKIKGGQEMSNDA